MDQRDWTREEIIVESVFRLIKNLKKENLLIIKKEIDRIIKERKNECRGFQ